MATLLDMQEISKSFTSVQVLKKVNFSLEAGEVHALLGENGAGKSTLMKILGGIYPKDQGMMYLKGQVANITSPRSAQSLGIAIIHQELNLIPHLTVMENIFLGREITLGKTGVINWNAMEEKAKDYLGQLGMNIDPAVNANELSVGQQQMVEIAKALSMHAEILVLDEPTAALTEREIDSLFTVMQNLKKSGVGMIYISHRMEEIFRICDRITVLRDGNYVGTRKTEETDLNDLVKMMVGREITERYPKIPVSLGPERLKVEGLTQEGKLDNVSFTVHGGEIVGFAGLMGAGRTELVKAICGIGPAHKGRIFLDGEQTKIRKPLDAMHHGVALITEDRKGEGLVLSLSVKENISLPNFNDISSLGFINASKEEELAQKTIKKFGIKTTSSEQRVGTLSGGNQQKVVIGKWLAKEPRVLILDEPTRGVDIGAKKEIYDLMNQLALQGVAIIMISSELPEVLGMSDRVLVMRDGRISGEFSRDQHVTQEEVMRIATGGEVQHAS